MGNWFGKEVDIELVQHKAKVTAGKCEKVFTLQILLDEPNAWDGRQNGLPTMKTVNYPIGCDQTEDRIEDLKWTKNPSGMPENGTSVFAKRNDQRLDQFSLFGERY